MSEHEPECWCRGCTHPHVCGRCRDCICDELRACEQRVRMEDDDYAYVAAQAEADGRRRGWVEALDAAREALLSAWFTANRDEMTWPDALAAIDALWEAPYGRNR